MHYIITFLILISILYGKLIKYLSNGIINPYLRIGGNQSNLPKNRESAGGCATAQ